METQKIETLLHKVIKASELKKIEWEKNPKSESSFKANLGYNTIHILNSGGEYYFVIINDSGDQIGALKGVLYSNELSKLYELAKRIALKIDENLDDLNSILDSII